MVAADCSSSLSVEELLNWMSRNYQIPRDCGVKVATRGYPYTGFPLGTDKRGIRVARIGVSELWWIALYASRDYTRSSVRYWVACVCRTSGTALSDTPGLLTLIDPVEVTSFGVSRLGLVPDSAVETIHGYLNREAGTLYTRWVKECREEVESPGLRDTHWTKVLDTAKSLACFHISIGEVERSPFWQVQS